MASNTSYLSFYLKNLITTVLQYKLQYKHKYHGIHFVLSVEYYVLCIERRECKLTASYEHKYHGIHFVLRVEYFVLEDAVSLLQATSTNTIE
jgi:hypothetical protein